MPVLSHGSKRYRLSHSRISSGKTISSSMPRGEVARTRSVYGPARWEDRDALTALVDESQTDANAPTTPFGMNIGMMSIRSFTIPGAACAVISHRGACHSPRSFADAFEIQGGGLAIVTGNATTPAASRLDYTEMANSQLKQYLLEAPDPALSLKRLSAFLIEETAGTEFANDDYLGLSASVSIVDPVSGAALVCAACGVPPVLRRADRVVCELSGTPTLPLGTRPESRYCNSWIQLSSTDTMVHSTDWMFRARGPEGPFGYDRFVRCFRESSSRPWDLCHFLFDQVAAFTSTVIPRDAMLVIMNRQ